MTTEPDTGDTLDSLRQKAAELEQQVRVLGEESRARLLMAELKAEALRAGIVDLDGLRLIDTKDLQIDEQGEVAGASAAMERFKRQKPWLFGSGASSSPAVVPPPSQPARQKKALEMTHEEYRAARAALVRRV